MDLISTPILLVVVVFLSFRTNEKIRQFEDERKRNVQEEVIETQRRLVRDNFLDLESAIDREMRLQKLEWPIVSSMILRMESRDAVIALLEQRFRSDSEHPESIDTSAQRLLFLADYLRAVNRQCYGSGLVDQSFVDQVAEFWDGMETDMTGEFPLNKSTRTALNTLD